MDIKRDILFRVYFFFIVLSALGVWILAKAFYIQEVRGAYWRNLGDSLHRSVEIITADRGSIFSADKQMLSTSVPLFSFYIDFTTPALQQRHGKLFYDNIDSLSFYLSDILKDKTGKDYKKMLTQAFTAKKKEHRFLLVKKVPYDIYKLLKTLPLLRMGAYQSGVVITTESIRENPYKMLAFRTIGLDRENAQKVGLEMSYDSVLKGLDGKRLVRSIANGGKVPIDDDYIIEPETGKDIVTTIDVKIQEITENALLAMLQKQSAQEGCAIVMEVKTGYIKAIANLGRGSDGNYYENYNYALKSTEPGSTFKVITLMSLLEDKKISLNTMVDLEQGKWQVADKTVLDSEKHGKRNVTAQQAFELSSNVGMAKLTIEAYRKNPSQYIAHLKQMHVGDRTGIDLIGEQVNKLNHPGAPEWNATTMAWMAFGYALKISPLQTAVLYNTIANNGRMMRPRLVQQIEEEGKIIDSIRPQIIEEKICSDATLRAVTTALIGVCNNPTGTAYSLCKDLPYKVAGKTGTSLVSEGGRLNYSQHIYQSSFVGFFPAENPQYTCVVVIENKPNAPVYYGATVAGPVFVDIANSCYGNVLQKPITNKKNEQTATANILLTVGEAKHIATALSYLEVSVNGNAYNNNIADVIIKNDSGLFYPVLINKTKMPSFIGMNLRDALSISDKLGLRVCVRGYGKIASQSIPEGSLINNKNRTVDWYLK